MNTLSLSVTKTFFCDTLVLGGGPAGIASAVMSARHGVDTILADQNGYLGGTATAGMVGPFMTSYDSDGKKQIIRGFFEEIVRRMEKEGGAIHPANAQWDSSYTAYRTKGHKGLTTYKTETLKRVSEDMCHEAGVKLMYHMFFIKAEVKDNRIVAAYFATKGGIYKVCAKVFIDCSGDADMAVSAGVPTVFGDGEGNVQASTLFFSVTGVDKAEMDAHMRKYEDRERRLYMKEIVEEREKGNYPLYRDKIMLFETFDDIWLVNMTQMDDVDGTDPEAVTQAEITGRQQIDYVLRFLKKYAAGCKNIRLVQSAATLGVRESRRIKGVYNTTKEDASRSVKFEDAIFCCSNAMDIHNKGFVTYVIRETNAPYYIPYRSLLPENIDNLLVAGRCAAGDREVLAAIRVMPPCFAMGQAAGTAAAMAVKKNQNPKDIDINALQSALIQDGAYLG